ncbi:hypothetical protein ONS95_005859 [Cadophora gregata]|uniref:uncharacterized protein n=1 Tax=Cadophora gregata TaxID=51156 RepID=UPI0026DADBDB|nr:uncharacterized protein ONS95_005859 [Cadophora gregata]KAK0102236.1 hypothetical protein ONS95_005859 [Cadophora gregata]KAK0103864.1 hypothetical protein ONS96_004973 [Cadophora gregata f. sp. sojae]
MSRQTFHPFSQLPTELRLKIWLLAQPDREIIHVTNAIETSPGDRHNPLLVPPRTVPSIFHVCVESREASLAVYKRGFEPDGGIDIERAELARFLMGDPVLPMLDMYWRPGIDVMLVIQYNRFWKAFRPACLLFASEAPFRGLQSHGVQHVILPVSFFNRRDWDPRTCGYTWGMETVYVILDRKKEDTPEFWEEHLAWFGRWWLKVCKPWRETVGADAPLGDRVPFLPMAVARLEGKELTSKDLDEARECVLVKGNVAGGAVAPKDNEIHTSRYTELWQ